MSTNIIRQYYDYFNAGDMESFFSLLHDDVVHDINQGERQVGKQAFMDFMGDMNHSYKEQIRDIVIMLNEDGTRAAAEFIVDGVYLATAANLPQAKQQHYSLPCGAFFEIRNNKITRVTNYYNLNSWLQQVGGQ